MKSSHRHTRSSVDRSKADVVSDFRRRQILDAARLTFAKRGLRDTTVSDIAREAGLAKGTVYLYFQSKDQILKHALGSGIDGLRDATVPALDPAKPFEALLGGFLRAMLTFFEANRDFMDLCQFELGTEVRQKARQHFGQIYAAQIDAWSRVLAPRMSTKAVPALQVARHIVSFAHGLALQRQRGWTDASLDADVTAATAMLLKGLPVT